MDNYNKFSTNLLIGCLVCVICLLFLACSTQSGLPKFEDGLYVAIKTNAGTIYIKLHYKEVPMTVSNFVGLAEGTINFKNNTSKRFYDGLIFHRVIEDFMIQGGDPLGNGTGGPGYKFPDEFVEGFFHDSAGILSMANSGPGTNGSQFFITHKATPWLDGKHTVFGKVIQGQRIVDLIKEGDVIQELDIIRIGDEAVSYTVNQEYFDQLIEEKTFSGSRAVAFALDEAEKTINAKWPNAIITASGLRFIVTEKGTGIEKPSEASEVEVYYVGKLLDGTEFDRTYDTPAVFTLDRVIPGFSEALQDMVAGEKRTAIIPPELAYGAAGYSGVIPPNSFIIFDIELVSF